MSDLFIEIDPISGNTVHFSQIFRNMASASAEDFRELALYLQKSSLERQDVLDFLEDLREYIFNQVENDPAISIIQYGRKTLYVCCSHLSSSESTGEFFITGFNCLPDFLLEGSGLRYWGDE